MKLFLLIFLTIYGSAHLYFYRKLTLAYSLSKLWRRYAAFMLLLITAVPLMIRTIEQHGHIRFATVLAYPGYIWMAVLFLFLSSSLCWDLAVALHHLSAVMRRKPRRMSSTPLRVQFQTCLGLALACALYGIFEAGNIRTEHVHISSTKIPVGSSPIRIVQLSDVHLGILMSDRKIQKIIATVNASHPDLLVCTGDFIDGNLIQDGMMVSQFQNIRPPMGSYAVFGNHEYYVGFEHSQEMLRKAGFSVLRGETVTSGPIAIAGADDLSAMRLNLYRKLPPQSSTVFTLLLKHQPIVSSDTPFDLQLSGHVHKGQIFPFNLVTWLRFHIKCGLTTLVDGRQIYVSRGTGTWGPPIRFLAPPEITVIDLVSN